MGRHKVTPLPCPYPGCPKPRRSHGVLRCEDHKGLRLATADRAGQDEDRIEPKPHAGLWYCKPCRRWVSQLIHRPMRFANPATV